MVEVQECFRQRRAAAKRGKEKKRKRKDGQAEEWMEARRPGVNRVGKF